VRAEVRLAFATDRTQALDLLPLPKRPSAAGHHARHRVTAAPTSCVKSGSRPRLAALRKPAAETAEAYGHPAHRDLPARHRELRRMLFAITAARRGRKDAR
jgi:hypothetical protein